MFFYFIYGPVKAWIGISIDLKSYILIWIRIEIILAPQRWLQLSRYRYSAFYSFLYETLLKSSVKQSLVKKILENGRFQR